MTNPARAYLATQVETTTQGELLIMLYEAAIKFLKRARVEIDNKDYAKKGIYISKAMAIIHELSESLNKDRGGDITPKLASLYNFCTSQLIKANIRMDTKRVDEVIQILEGLRSAYAQIVPEHDGKTATAAATPQAPSVPPVSSPSTPPQPAVSPGQPAEPATAELSKEKPPRVTAPPPAPASPPKMRSAANAAKFRAANAYTNANR